MNLGKLGKAILRGAEQAYKALQEHEQRERERRAAQEAAKPKVLKGLLFRVEVTDTMVKFTNHKGKGFTAPRKAIQAVTVTEAPGFGATAKLQVVGGGTVLGEAVLTRPDAEKAQAWLMEVLGL